MTEDPIALFGEWYAAAKSHAGIADATAMALATADRAGRPSVRMVLLKGFDARGFVFYTNLTSPKSHDLTANPEAELCFYWAPLGKQVRVHGRVEPVTVEETDHFRVMREFCDDPRGFVEATLTA